MPDRTIILAQNGRHGVRGVSALNPSEFEAYHEDDDALTYVVDMASYLGSDTISSVTRTPSGPTVSNESNTTTQLSQRLKGSGHVDFKVATAGGDVEEFRIYIRSRVSSALEDGQAAEVPDPMAQTYTSTSDPTRDDDTGDGHWVGRFWLNTATGNLFFNKVNAAGAAVWGHVPRILASSAVAASVTGTTSETTLATISIPANVMGISGILALSDTWTHTNSANNKNLRARLGGIGGTVVMNITATTTLNYADERRVQNRGVANSQTVSISNGGTLGGYGTGVSALATPVVDTTADFDLVLTGQLANSGETITLERYEVTLIRPDIT